MLKPLWSNWCVFNQEDLTLMNHGVLLEVVILLAFSVVAVALFRRFKLPSVLAYLMVGIVIGPYGMALISAGDDLSFLAEFGVVFLLFSIGLEFSLPQLIAMRKEVVALGGMQVLVTTLVVAGIALAFGLPLEAAFILGGIFAMSSTAIVTKQLSEQLELHSRHGRIAIGILLFQDVAVVPFLIAIPALASASGEGGVFVELIIALLKGAVIVVVMLALGHWLLRPLFNLVAKFRSSELFTLNALLFALAAAWLTHSFGLSLALGAFIAGMMLSETEFKHQVEADIRPFRDVLLGLFFVTIGMLLDVQVMIENLHWILLLLLVLTLFKVLSIAGLAQWAGNARGVSLRAGLSLGQGGEFGLALLMLAMTTGLFHEGLTQVVVATLIMSMVVAPFMLRYNGAIAKRFSAGSYVEHREELVEEVRQNTAELKGHVIICGYGRTGQNIARLLEKENFEYVALELDPIIVQEARAAGERVTFGDSTHSAILMAAGLENARAVVISYDDIHSAEKILVNIRNVQPDVPVLVRTANDSALERLQEAGATEVVPDTLEAALMLASHLLLLLNVPVAQILRQTQAVRRSRYGMLKEFFHGQEPESLDESEAFRERLHSVVLPEGAYAVGRTIRELDLGAKNITVTAVRRNGIKGADPSTDMRLKEDDTLILYGAPEDIEKVESMLLTG